MQTRAFDQSCPTRVNLLPADYVQRHQRVVRLRRWIAVGVMVLAVQIAAGVVLAQLAAPARRLQAGLEAAVAQKHALAKRLSGIAIEQTELDKQMRLADQLNRKHRWSDLLACVSRAMPGTVVLTRCESDPARSKLKTKSVLPIAKPAKPGEADAPAAADVAEGLLISGVATDHDSVAVFLRNLNGTGGVGRCTLESTVRQPYLNSEGVFFTIRTRW